MNIQSSASALILAITFSSTAYATSDEDITIRMMENNETTQDSVTRVIPLPDKNRFTQQVQTQNQNQLQKKKQLEDDSIPTDEIQQRIREQEQLREMQELQLQLENQHNDQIQNREPQAAPEIPDMQNQSNNTSRP